MQQSTVSNFWISSQAVTLTLNALGNRDYVQVGISSGAIIMVYVEGIIGYDVAHNYQRWPLVAFPTVFADSAEKFLYARIPGAGSKDRSAMLVYSSERLDLFGNALSAPNPKDPLSSPYYFIYLAHISDSTAAPREFLENLLGEGRLSTDQNLQEESSLAGWKDMFSWNAFRTMIFPKAPFEYLLLGKDKKKVTNVQRSVDDMAPSDEVVPTTALVQSMGEGKFLSKQNDDVAEGRIRFRKGLDAEQSITVSGVLIDKPDSSILTVHGDLAVMGEVTSFAQGSLKDKTILDGLPIDGTTLSKEGGFLHVIGGGGGGGEGGGGEGGGGVDLNEVWKDLATENEWKQIHVSHIRALTDHLADVGTHVSDKDRSFWNTAGAHVNDTGVHVSGDDRLYWNAAGSHVSDTVKHITALEREAWNKAAEASHTHTNLAVLNGITKENVTSWNGKLNAADAVGRKTPEGGEVFNATDNVASMAFAHAEGQGTKALGRASHAGGVGTVANNEGETAVGRFNISQGNTLFSVGHGSSTSARSNAFEVTRDGDAKVAKDLSSSTMTVDGVLIDKDPSGVLTLHGDLAVMGEVTSYAQGNLEPSTILDGLPIDGTTLSKEGNVLHVIGGGGGGGTGLDVRAMWEALATESLEQVHISHFKPFTEHRDNATVHVSANDRKSWNDAVTHTYNHNHTGIYSGAYALTIDDNGNLVQTGMVYIGASYSPIPAVYATALYENGQSLSARYAAINHNHNGVYALVNHNHAGVYSPVGHNHDTSYAPIVHTHSKLVSSAGQLTLSPEGLLLPDTGTFGLGSSTNQFASAYAAVVYENGMRLVDKYLRQTGGFVSGKVAIGDWTNHPTPEYALELNGGMRIGGKTSTDMSFASPTPQLCFGSFEGGKYIQQVKLLYTDYNDYRPGMGLKIVGQPGTLAEGGDQPLWLEVDGNFYVNQSAWFLKSAWAKELTIDGVTISKNESGVLTVHGDLAVEGEVTSFAQGSLAPSTILDGLPIDGTTLSKEGNVLHVIGGGGGGGTSFDARVMWEALATESLEQVHISHFKPFTEHKDNASVHVSSSDRTSWNDAAVHTYNHNHKGVLSGNYALSLDERGNFVPTGPVYIGADYAPVPAIYATTFYEGGETLSTKYAPFSHSHSEISKGSTSVYLDASGVLLPSRTGVSVGSVSRPFQNMYATVAYEGGVSLSEKYLQLSGGRIAGDLALAGNLSADGAVKGSGFSGSSIRIETDAAGAATTLRQGEINCYDSTLFLQYDTNNDTRLCVGGGNVGIGASAPVYRLDVDGTVSASGGYLRSVANGASIQIGSWNELWSHYDSSAKLGHWFNKPVYVQGDVYAGNKYDRMLAYDDAVLHNTGGKVTGNLEVTGRISTDDTLSCYGIVSSTVYIETDIHGTAAQERMGEINCYESPLFLQQDSATGLRLCGAGGNVTIGNWLSHPSPEYSLELNGGIRIVGKTSTDMSFTSPTPQLCFGSFEGDKYVQQVKILYTDWNSYRPGMGLKIVGQPGTPAEGGDQPLWFEVDGNIIASGEITAYSDARLKTNVKPLEDRGRLKPVSYIKDGKPSIGFLAQDVQPLYPELVTDGEYLSLNYAQLTAVLAAQLNDANDKIASLESRLAALESRLS